MAWVPKDPEIDAVLSLDDASRYRYCVKKAADEGCLWSLQFAGTWALASDPDGHQVVPVWPHQSFAVLCALGAWAGYEAKSIKMDVWLSRWIPGMEKDCRLVGVFPTPKDRGVVVPPKRIEADLLEELEQYE